MIVLTDAQVQAVVGIAVQVSALFVFVGFLTTQLMRVCEWVAEAPERRRQRQWRLDE